MGNNSSDCSQTIVLPKGGGALQGLGEKFTPDLHTGTGNFTVPIAVPPGRNGFQPQLSLVYSTGVGNGPLGLGWNLSIPGISRKTSRGVPLYDDSKDVFILSGAEDLVAIGEVGNVTQFRPRTEGLFAEVLYHRDAANSYWEVRSKDGLVSFYGNEASFTTDSSAIADPANKAKVFAWKLTRTEDPFGNRIEYEYEHDSEEKGPHHWDQLYLSRIRYVDYDDDKSGTKYLVSVEFVYEGRPDPFSEYRPGFEIRTGKRCTGIVIQTHEKTAQTVRSYELTYLDQRPEKSRLLPSNGVSLLSLVKVTGHDGDSKETLPPLEFGYTIFEPQKRDFFPVEGSALPATSLANPDLELVDLFGNGLPDLLEMNGAVRYWRNLGQGRFDMPRFMQDAPAGISLSDPGVQFIDANGDGRTDLLVNNGAISGYFPLTFDGKWDRRSFQRYSKAPTFNLKDPEVRLVDLDGDGITDAIRSGNRLECFFNNALEGWNYSRFVERKAIDVFPNVSFADPRVKLADFSGDGLQDVALVSDRNIQYWPNLGRGDWGMPVHMENSPSFPYGYDPRRILIGDVDGDGLADLVYVEDTRVTLWINQSGNRWSDPVTVSGTPPVSDTDAVRLVDILGSGIVGVLWTRDANGLARDHFFFLDFTGSLKPYLLHEMDNHIGAVTKVDYGPSTRFYLDDQKLPGTRWKTTLPFPVHVVSRVEVIDYFSKGKLTTEYGYHHGYWDGAEREFRGFGMVEQRDTESFGDFNTYGLHGPATPFVQVDQKYFSPPTLTRTWFHQGPVGDELADWQELDCSDEYWIGDPPLLNHIEAVNQFLGSLAERRFRRDALRSLRGSILRTELYALDDSDRQNRPYTVSESSYGVFEIDAPAANADRLHIFYPHGTSQRTTQWERGDDPMTQFSFTRYTDQKDRDRFDPFGRPLAQTQIACPRGWRKLDDAPAEPFLATRSVTAYAEPIGPQPAYIHTRTAKTTSYEIANTSGKHVMDLVSIADSGIDLMLIGQTLSFYDGAPFVGLELGRVDRFGAVTRTESLVLTDEVLQNAYGDEIPPYLETTGNTAWTSEYPLEFRTLLPRRAGYTFHVGSADPTDPKGYFVNSSRVRYDFQSTASDKVCGLVLETLDPLHDATVDPSGHRTLIDYDKFRLLPVQVTDAAGVSLQALNDYRVLQPREVTDPNCNRSIFTFSPLGFLESSSVRGQSSAEGDQTRPGVRMEYGFRAFEDSSPENRQPIFVRSIRQIHHDTELDVPLPERDGTITSAEYSDGFGRLLQTRTQGEDVRFGDENFGGGEMVLPLNQSDGAGGDVVGRRNTDLQNPNVVVSGWRVYDNKGQIVEQYESFFSEGWAYAEPGDAKTGQKVIMFYDPRGQVIRTLNPNGSEQLVVFGVPGRISAPDLTRPDTFEPTAWEAYTYDANDNAGRTHPMEASSYCHHWDTPASIIIDPLGRTIKAVSRNRDAPAVSGGPLPPIEELTTRTTYDIRGNVLIIFDALARPAFQHFYDFANRTLRIESIDAGLRQTVLDAAGGATEQRDSKGALMLHGSDNLNRPLRLWARDGTGEKLTLRERREYGDAGDPCQSPAERKTNLARNCLGKLSRSFDEAGLLSFETYDFKGNLLEKTRSVVSDAAILAVFSPPPAEWKVEPFRVDWSDPAAVALDGIAFTTNVSYDALSRVKLMIYPEDVENQRRELRPQYNRAGALERLAMDADVFVERISYSAKGERVLIAYGNGIMTRYAYDPQTFRLGRLRTEGYSNSSELLYRHTGDPVQELTYEFDLAGNILRLLDRTPGCGIKDTMQGSDALDREFLYDATYRLRSASGRECDRPPDSPWDDTPRCTDMTRTRAYTQQYCYDSGGNIIKLKLSANGAAHNRVFGLVARNDRLISVTVGQAVFGYEYDCNGNMIAESSSRHFEWDGADRMRVYRTQTLGGEPSLHAHYLYDSSGQRVKKLVRKQGGNIEVTISIDGIFEYQRTVSGGALEENNTLHVVDDHTRVALVRVGNPLVNDITPPIRYHIQDHLGNITLVINRTGALLNREEFTPFGETSFGSYSRKRYRFTGKERDEESGLSYHGARYYAPHLGKWTSCDPAWIIDGLNLYVYVRNNPVLLRDLSGMGSNDFGLTSAPGGTAPPDTTSTEPLKDRDASAPITAPGSNTDSSVSNVITIREVTVRSTVNPRGSRPTTGIGDFLATTVGLIWPQYVAPNMRAKRRDDLPPGLADLAQLNFTGAQGSLYLNSDLTAAGAAGVGGGLALGIVGPPFVAASEPIPAGALYAKGGLTAAAAALYVGAGIHTAEITAGSVGVGSLGYVASSRRIASYGAQVSVSQAGVYNRLASNPGFGVGPGGISDGFAKASNYDRDLLPAAFGKALELRGGQALPNVEKILGNAYQPDAIVRLGKQAVNVDWTTLGQLAQHLQRPYLQRSFLILLHPGLPPGW